MKREIKSYDILLVLLVCAVAVFGITIIGSATHIKANGISAEYRAQWIWFLSGLAMLIVVSFIDYHFICKFYILGYVVNLLMLIALFFFASDTNNVARWIKIGDVGIQPSEFSKILMMVFLAKFLDVKKDSINKPGIFAFLIICTLVPVYLIMEQPSLSASLVVLFISVCVIYAAKLSYKYIVGVLLIIIPIGTFVYVDIHRETPFIVEKGLVQGYMVERVVAVLYPDDKDSNTFQTERSVRVIASGQMEGKGLYNGIVNQINYVPKSHNDFIFAVIGEEFGFFGSVLCLGVMLLIIFKCILIAEKAPDMTGRLIGVGTASMLAFQTFVNVGVATGIVPNTGMPLPFISYGGSAMWSCMISIGLCINVGMFRIKSFFE